jgi:hypothetical protein
MAKAALREAARLGAMAVEETGYGVPDDKREKNRFAAEDVWNYFRGLRTKGVVSESKDVVENCQSSWCSSRNYSFNESHFHRDFQNPNLNQITKCSSAFATSVGCEVY